MSRDQILARIRQNRPEPRPLPEPVAAPTTYDDRVAKFRETLTFIGGQSLVAGDYAQAAAYIRQTYADLQTVVCQVPELRSLATITDRPADPHDLADVELAILPGAFGVAENAAVWLPEESMGHRVLPFICQHLVLIISEESLVSNLHEAYARLNPEETGFGVFIAGPSKTADIEQSLVIGAHGARSLLVIILHGGTNF